MELENLKEQNPVALKMVNSELQNTSPNIAEYFISPEIVRSCKEAGQRNQEHLEDEKKKKAGIQKHWKRKAVQTELQEIKKKKAEIAETSKKRMQ